MLYTWLSYKDFYTSPCDTKGYENINKYVCRCIIMTVDLNWYQTRCLKVLTTRQKIIIVYRFLWLKMYFLYCRVSIVITWYLLTLVYYYKRRCPYLNSLNSNSQIIRIVNIFNTYINDYYYIKNIDYSDWLFGHSII